MMTFSRRAWVIGVAIMVVAAVIASVIVWRARTSKPVVLTPATVKASLLQTTKVAIPPVVRSSTIAVTQLPSFMRTLILPQATGTTALAVLYKGSLNGYEILYMNPEVLKDVYGAFTGSVGKAGWRGTRGLLASTFGYFEFSGNGLVARAEFSSVAASSTSIVIRAIQQ